MGKLIVDGHCDLLLNYLRDENYMFEENTKFHIDLPKLKKANIALEVFAACPAIKGDKAFKKTIKLIDKFYNLLENNNEVKLAKNYSDIKNIINENKIAAILAVEGADGIFDLSALRIFYKLGVRLITLTWNYSNHIADGIDEIEAGGGVTTFGKKFIKEMNNLGMIIDTSHLSTKSFWDVIKYSDEPVVASHSNAKGVYEHPRNLNDEQIKAIAEVNGIIGINFCPEFIKNKQSVKIKDLVEHIIYIKELVGIDYIALGTDYDGISKTPENLENISKINFLVDKLKKVGFNKNEINKFTNKNWLRLYKEILE